MKSIDWNLIDTVLLDMDGTLLDLHFDNFFWLEHLPQRYAEHHGICPDQATTDLHRRFNEKRGTLEWYCLDYWSQELAVDIVNIKREVKNLIAERPFVQEFLDITGSRGISRILVTNAHRKSLELKLSVTGIGEKLDRIVSSHDYGHPKESQTFWALLQTDIHFDPQRTVFFDDSESVLQAAKDYGIAHTLMMRQPDSRHPPRNTGDWLAILHFDEIVADLHRAGSSQ
ncbi:MAG: GMP/IMP nucleotidase [bacterium]